MNRAISVPVHRSSLFCGGHASAFLYTRSLGLWLLLWLAALWEPAQGGFVDISIEGML